MSMSRVALEALEGRELLASVAPDRSFGDDGTSHIDYVGSFIDEARVMAVQRDGKIVMAGTSEASQIEMLLARFHPNGKRDKSFGNGGIMRKSVGFTDPQDVAVQRDGKILLAGTVLNELAVVRLNANGSADKSFGGGDGVAQVTILTDPVRRFGEANGIHVLKDGSILVAGSARARVGGDHDIVVARLRPDGSGDTSFGGGDGWAHVGSTEHESARDLAVDKAGRIVVAGSSGTKGALFRFTRKGAVDGGFGEGGVLALPQRSFRSEELYSVRATDNGGIVASGRGAGGVMVVGVDAGGEPVSSFGREGRRDYVLHRGWDAGVEVIPRTGGAFTVLGQTGTTRRDGGTNPQRAGVYLMHFRADGRWDREAGGKVRLRSFSGGRGLDRADAARLADGSFAVVANDVHRLDDVRVMRVTQKGAAARSFARGRGVRIDVRGPLPLTPKAFWEQRDGKLLVVSDREQSGQNGVLVRLHADGSIDESFGDEGYLTLEWPGGELYWHVLRFAEQADGKLLVAGPVPGEGHRMRIVRLNEDGTRDTSFGSGGARELNDLYKPEVFVVRPDGTILVGGGDGDGEIPDVDWRLRRLNADGSTDDTFATDFRVRAYHEFNHVLSEPGGGLLLVGTTAHVTEDWRPHEGPRPIGDDIVLVRLEADGSLDDSYYDGGVRIFDDIRATHVLDVRRLKGSELRILSQDRWRDTGQGWFRHVRIDGDGAVTSFPVYDGKFGWRTAVAPNGDLLLFYENNTVRLKPDGTTQVLEPVVEYYNLLGSDADGRVYVGSRDEANGFVVTRWLVD